MKRQSQSGIIAFYSKHGFFLYERKYRFANERKAHIDYARSIYGKAFSEMYYQISPNINKKKLDKMVLPEPALKAA